MLLILKQHLLPVYYFTIKQTGLIIIKRKAFRNHTLFVPLQRFSSTSLFTLLCAYIFAFKATISVMIFPPSSSFIRPITFLFSLMGSSLLLSFKYQLVSNLFSVKVFSLYLINRPACIHIAQTNFTAILRPHIVVMKLKHQHLT